MTLKSHTAPGEDQITSNNLKDIVDLVSLPLSLIINNCIENGIFPDYLKRTILKPIYKGGDRKNISNYRPIALLNVFAKIFEKVLKIQLVDFITANTGFDKFQYAFQQQSNTQAAVNDFMSSIHETLDTSNYGVAIFIDLKKAFDTVNHTILLDILDNLGIRGQALNIFQNYFRNRIQYALIDQYKSYEKVLTFGVPQGSVLAPILYLIYVNSIMNINLIGKHFSFADDTVLYHTSKNVQTLKTNLEKDIKTIEIWLNELNLTINSEKTVYMIFKQKNMENIKLNIIIKNRTIAEAEKHKYLGLIIDKNLNFESHIEKIKNSVIPLIGAIRRIQFLRKDIQLLIYNAHIMSRIRYMITVWSSCSQKQKEIIYRLMNKAIKVIFGKPWDTPSSELYKSTSNMTLNQLIKFEKAKFAFKLTKNIQKSNTPIQKNSKLHSHNTRILNHFHLDNIHSNKGKTNPVFSSIETFNKLPEQIKNSKTIISFSKNLKEYLLLK